MIDRHQIPQPVDVFKVGTNFLDDLVPTKKRWGTVRADAIYGIGPDIALLLRHNLCFFVKGNSCFTAKRILRELDPSYDEWRRIDETTWAFDANYVPIRRCPYPVRTILTKQLMRKEKLSTGIFIPVSAPKRWMRWRWPPPSGRESTLRLLSEMISMVFI